MAEEQGIMHRPSSVTSDFWTPAGGFCSSSMGFALDDFRRVSSLGDRGHSHNVPSTLLEGNLISSDDLPSNASGAADFDLDKALSSIEQSYETPGSLLELHGKISAPIKGVCTDRHKPRRSFDR